MKHINILMFTLLTLTLLIFICSPSVGLNYSETFKSSDEIELAVLEYSTLETVSVFFCLKKKLIIMRTGVGVAREFVSFSKM